MLSTHMLNYFYIQELFKAVVPRDCLGCVWSRRDKKENKTKPSSVKATVNQFNAVSRRVTTTILFGEAQGSPSITRRAKRLEAWIEIAQVCTWLFRGIDKTIHCYNVALLEIDQDQISIMFYPGMSRYEELFLIKSNCISSSVSSNTSTEENLGSYIKVFFRKLGYQFMFW